MKKPDVQELQHRLAEMTDEQFALLKWVDLTKEGQEAYDRELKHRRNPAWIASKEAEEKKYASLIEAEARAMPALMAAYFGEKWESHYQSAFSRLVKMESGSWIVRGTFIWNWAAALLGPLWAGYRRLYVIAISTTVLSIIPGVLIVIIGVMGAFGDRFVLRRALRFITSNLSEPPDIQLALAEKMGKPNRLFVAIFIAGVTLGILGNLLRLLLS